MHVLDYAIGLWKYAARRAPQATRVGSYMPDSSREREAVGAPEREVGGAVGAHRDARYAIPIGPLQS